MSFDLIGRLREIADTLQNVNVRQRAKAPNTSGTGQSASILPSGETIASRIFAVERGVVSPAFAGPEHSRHHRPPRDRQAADGRLSVRARSRADRPGMGGAAFEGKQPGEPRRARPIGKGLDG